MKNFKKLFENLCCSQCKNDFSLNSLTILERKNDVLICNLKCEKCGKDFGHIVFKYDNKAQKHSALEVIDGPAPISVDDVLDAHIFIKNNLK